MSEVNVNRPARTIHVPQIMTHGGDAARNGRRRVITEVLRAYHRYAPERLAYFIWFLAEITKVEHNSGEWKRGGAVCTLRLPDELFNCLKWAFEDNLPDQPVFGACDDDMNLLYQEAPKLLPGGPRQRKTR